MVSRQKICGVSKKFKDYAESAKIMLSRQKNMPSQQKK